jgi:hypothetical protein
MSAVADLLTVGRRLGGHALRLKPRVRSAAPADPTEVRVLE